MKIVSIGSSNLVELDQLKNESTGEFVNDATVSATLRDSTLQAVSGASSMAMAYVDGSNGKYQGTVPHTVTLTDEAKYYLDITATSGGLVLLIRLPCRAQYDRG